MVVRVLHRKTLGAEAGASLLAVLIILLVVATASAGFVWFMNQEQGRAGGHYYATAALEAAEAGLHRTLTILESTAPDGSTGRIWRPAAYTERLSAGPLQHRFTVSVVDDVGGAVIVTSNGTVGGAVRRLRARVHLASSALLAALYTAGMVHLEAPPALTVVLAYGAAPVNRPWVHIAAGKGLKLASADAAVQQTSGTLELSAGPADPPASLTRSERQPTGPIRILLARDAMLYIGQESIDPGRLRAPSAFELRKTENFPGSVDVDRGFFRSLAEANTANAALNKAAGEYAGDAELARKRDSLYAAGQFAQIRAYLRTGQVYPTMRGVIYVKGGMAFLEGQHLVVADGSLVAESTVHLAEGAVLEITHSASVRFLPGVLVLDLGALVISQKARLHAHGLVFAARTIEVTTEGVLDVVGAVSSADQEVGFRNAAKVAIRYDQATLGTLGVSPANGDPVIAWVAVWEELR